MNIMKITYLLLISAVLIMSSCVKDDIVAAEGTILIEKEKDVAIDPGGSIQMSATYYELNEEFTEAKISWKIADESVASVSENGLVTALSKGFTTVYASAYGFESEKLMIQVVDDTTAVFESTIITTNPVLLVSGTTTLNVENVNINGNTTSSSTVIWTSLNNTASITPGGVVTALSTGTAQFVATVDGVETPVLEIAIGDDPNAIALVEVVGSTNMVMSNESLTLTANVKNFNGDLLTGQTITWSSSDPSIATVSAAGVVNALTEGDVTITAEVNGISGTFALKIMDALSQTRTAILQTIDYTTEGTAILELTPSNELKLNFINFNAPQALSLPGVVIYLANNIQDARAAKSDGLQVGAVPQTSGNFTMTINSLDPAGDFTKYSHVFLICAPFSVPYGGGELSN